MSVPRPDPSVVRGLARSVEEIVSVLVETARAYGHLLNGGWTGPAAEAAADRLALFSHDLSGAAAHLRDVCAALATHAGVLDDVVERLDAADRHEAQAAALPPGPQAVTATEAAALVATTLRADAESLLALSTATTATAVAAATAAASPALKKVRDFHPQVAGWHWVADHVDAVPGLGWLAGDLHRMGRDPHQYFHGNDVWVEEHGGHLVDDAMDGAALVPGLGVPIDLLHCVLNLWRGRWTDATVDGVGVAPVVGDAAQLGRKLFKVAAAKTLKLATEAQFAWHHTDVFALAGDHLRARLTPGYLADVVDTGLAVGGDRAGYERALKALSPADPAVNPAPVCASALDHATDPHGLMRSRAIRWEGPTPAGVFDPDQRPAGWRGSAEVEEGGRLVTYAFTLTRGGRVTASPTPLRTRAVAPDVSRPAGWAPTRQPRQAPVIPESPGRQVWGT